MINHQCKDKLVVDFAEIRLQEEEFKNELERTKSIHVHKNVEAPPHAPPNIVGPLSKYEAWLELGRLLINFGELFKAKTYIVAALKNAEISNNGKVAADVYVSLGRIRYLEGESS